MRRTPERIGGVVRLTFCFLNILLQPVLVEKLFSGGKKKYTEVLLERHSFHSANFCKQLWRVLQTSAVTGEVEEVRVLRREYCKNMMGGRGPL